MAKKVKIAKKEEIKHDPVREAILKVVDYFKKLSKTKYFTYTIYGVIGIVAIVAIFVLYKSSTKPGISQEADYYLIQTIVALANQDTIHAPALLDSLTTTYRKTTSGMRAFYYAGAYYLKRGDNEKALMYFKKFLSTPINDKLLRTFTYAQMSDIYVDLKKFGSALSCIKKAYRMTDQEPLKAYYYYKMAKIYYLKGDIKKSRDLLAEFEKKFPKSALKNTVNEELNFLKGMLGEVN